jgi:3-hydroxybutyryl-CoA dehydrogenase
MKQNTTDTSEIIVGVVGLGMMGCSITTCLLIAGHEVIAVAPIVSDIDNAENRIMHHLQKAWVENMLEEQPETILRRLVITEEYKMLEPCHLVIECTIESKDIKKEVYRKIEDFLSPTALLVSNTSAIPITILQAQTSFPGRFLGLHWAEPSHTTRFLEIICGAESDPALAEWLAELSVNWGKEPTIVRKDIRGFITNRLMYALYREAFYLVENGYASVEDVDRACRNNAGYWMTLVGIFRWMDLTGLPAYHNVMKDLFPTLSNQTEVPGLIDNIVKTGGKGVLNGKGFYEYTEEEARIWEETFIDFSYEIRRLALKYPVDVVKRKVKELAEAKND